MLKRTLIAIAVVALLATSSAQALGPEPHTGGGNSPAIKVNNVKMEIGWPFEYKALSLCVIPVYMNVGYYVQMEKCNERKIKLVQVECSDMEKGSDWPCYQDCEDMKIRANFEVKLGTKLENKTGVIDKMAAYYKGGDIVDASGDWNTITVCVEAWKTKLYKSSPGSQVKVADLVITVKPNV
jgi:heme/copper-type cytochrome/quinol oxidase subunit 2